MGTVALGGGRSPSWWPCPWEVAPICGHGPGWCLWPWAEAVALGNGLAASVGIWFPVEQLRWVAFSLGKEGRAVG